MDIDFACNHFFCICYYIFAYRIDCNMVTSCFFLILSYLVLLFQRYDNKVFLEGTAKKHIIRVENGCVYVDKKQRRSIKNFLLYKYKNYLLLILNGKFYLVPNDAYTIGRREEFLLFFRRQVLNRFVLKRKLQSLDNV